MSFKVFFAGDREYAFKHAPAMSIVLWPHEDQSRDLGYCIQARMLVRTHAAPLESQSPVAFIAEKFKDCSEAMEFVLKGRQFAEVRMGQLIADREDMDSRSEEPRWFATLQGGVDEYRELVRGLGAENAIEALKVARDIVALNIGEPPAEIKQAVVSEAFRLAVLRSNERYFAYRRGATVLLGNEAESLQMSEASATVRFHLAGFKGRHEVGLRFQRSDLFDRRINVLIGENGVGKSQTLAHIVRSLAKLKDSGYVVSTEPFSRVVAFSAVPAKSSLPNKLKSQRVLRYRHFSLSPRTERRRGDNPLAAALVDLARDETRVGGQSRVQIFKNALGSWLPLSRICLRVKEDRPHNNWHYAGADGHHYLPLARLLEPIGDGAVHLLADVDLTRGPEFFAPRRTEDGEFEAEPDDESGPTGAAFQRRTSDRSNLPERRGMQPLSSGQELFFRFALNLSTFIEAGTLVLLDEPENHLHPTFITRLMALLRHVLRSTGSFAVIATHSPFVVREVTRMDVSIMSRSEDGSPLVRHPRLQTLGASVAAVSGYVFGDETVPTLARLTVEAMVSVRQGTDPNSEEGLKLLSRELSNEAVAYIRAELLRSEREGGSKA